MFDSESEELSSDELIQEFDQLFPQGFAGPDVMRELAPDGWEKTPWCGMFRKVNDPLANEMTQSLRSLETWKPGDPMPVFPTMDDISKRLKDAIDNPPPEPSEVPPEAELREMLGRCLWDIFSDNHDVLAEDGRELHLGSFRGSAGFLAEYLNKQTGTDDYFYMDFYMGHGMAGGDREEFRPVYEMIFRRLKARGLDWKYSFPRLGLVDFRPMKEAMDREKNPESEYENYDPSEAFEKEEENRKHDEEISEMREKLDEGYREAVEEALDKPPPITVQAYEAVFGEFPAGWPPDAEE